MANESPGVSIAALKTAIATQLAAAFPAFLTVEFHRDDESMDGMPTPALLLDMPEVEPAPDEDGGSGQWPAMPRFEARLILADVGSVTKNEASIAAVALATWLNCNRWAGIVIGKNVVIACEPDTFAPDVPGWVVWRVEWTAVGMFGVSAWDNIGGVPSACYSITPNIGLAHIDDYIPLGEAQP